MRPQVRSVDENVKRFAAGGRRPGLGAARGRQVTSRVRRRLTLFVDPLEFLVRIAAENKAVMYISLIGVYNCIQGKRSAKSLAY